MATDCSNKKNGFKWGALAQQAFDALKKRMTKAPVLRLPNFEEQFELEYDASGTGIGAILMQNCHPIAYFS